jgi:hypothetical protein
MACVLLLLLLLRLLLLLLLGCKAAGRHEGDADVAGASKPDHVMRPQHVVVVSWLQLDARPMLTHQAGAVAAAQICCNADAAAF